MVQSKKTKFRQIYDALSSKPVAPKTAFVREIAALVRVDSRTVRYWLAGTQKPDAFRTSVIAEHLGVPENELFA